MVAEKNRKRAIGSGAYQRANVTTRRRQAGKDLGQRVKAFKLNPLEVLNTGLTTQQDTVIGGDGRSRGIRLCFFVFLCEKKLS